LRQRKVAREKIRREQTEKERKGQRKSEHENKGSAMTEENKGSAMTEEHLPFRLRHSMFFYLIFLSKKFQV
jgi:hypothetical protein